MNGLGYNHHLHCDKTIVQDENVENCWKNINGRVEIERAQRKEVKRDNGEKKREKRLAKTRQTRERTTNEKREKTRKRDSQNDKNRNEISKKRQTKKKPTQISDPTQNICQRCNDDKCIAFTAIVNCD